MKEQQEKQTVPLSLRCRKAKRQATEARVKELEQRLDELERRKTKGWPWKLW